jgi:hypothetical protein
VPRPGGAAFRPGGGRPFGFRMNPIVSFWTQQVRRGIQRQLQFVDLYGRELKALDGALGQGQPPPRWGGGALLGGRPWGAGLWSGANAVSPYNTLDASNDTGGSTIDVSTTDSTDTSTEPAPTTSTEGDDNAEPSDLKSVPHAKLFDVFEYFDDKHHHSKKYFTEDLYPKTREVNEELSDRGYGEDHGYASLRSADVHQLYDRYVHHEALEESTGTREHDDDDKPGGKSAKKPDTDDLVDVFGKLYRAHKELTQDGVPYVDDVNEFLGDEFKHVDADKVERAFNSSEAKKIRDKWFDEEKGEGDFDENKEKRATNDDLIDAFNKLRPSDLTRAGYPRESTVNRLLAKGLQSVDAARIKRVFDSSDARAVADKLRKK